MLHFILLGQWNITYFFKGFDESYAILTWHGENEPNLKISDIGDQVDPPYMDFTQDEVVDIIHDAYKHCDDEPTAFKSL